MTTHYSRPTLGALLIAALMTAACAQSPTAAPAAPVAPAASITPVKPAVAAEPNKALAAPAVAQPTELKIIDRLVGVGEFPVEKMNPIVVHYTGYLWDPSKPDNKGAQFDTSIPRVVPLGLTVGVGRVIPGWDEGLIGMRAGGQRTLIIPADKAYGAAGSPPKIPPNAALVFDIELMGIIGKLPLPKAEPSPYVPAKDSAKDAVKKQ